MAWWLATIGRLKPDGSIARANAQMLAVTPAILQETIHSYDAEGPKSILIPNSALSRARISELRQDPKRSLWCSWGFPVLFCSSRAPTGN